MQVQQAVFTSARTSRMAGYQLVAKSAGVTEDLARWLSQWGPTHSSLLDASPEASSLCFVAGDQHWFVMARTVYGGPEYSQRGGRQIVTRFLVMNAEQFAAYGNNPVTVLRTAITLGHLRWRDGVDPRLPELDMPDEVPLSTARMQVDTEHHQFAQEALACLARHGRVALVGPMDACPVLEAMLTSVPPSERVAFSFATGLRPSIQRPYRIHFLPSATPPYRRQLAGMGIPCLVLTASPAGRVCSC